MQREFMLSKVIGERGLSIADLSRMTGFAHSKIDVIIRTGSGRLAVLEKIAVALGLSCDDLYYINLTKTKSKQSEQLNKNRRLRSYEVMILCSLNDLLLRLMQAVARIELGVIKHLSKFNKRVFDKYSFFSILDKLHFNVLTNEMLRSLKEANLLNYIGFGNSIIDNIIFQITMVLRKKVAK